MGLNKSTGNMYEWVTHTWNAIKGQCPHDCSYCYMKRWGKLNPVRLDRKEFKTDLGSGNFIFVGSSCDIFAELLPGEWIAETICHCSKFDNHYLFQSKNPMRFWPLLDKLPREIVSICTTIETNRWYPDIMRKSPKPESRAQSVGSNTRWEKYVTIEPIMDFDLDELVNLIRMCDPIQVNIGADSGNNGLPEPDYKKVLELIDALKEFTTISKKRNLARLE
jgi:DNA repair photolyase